MVIELVERLDAAASELLAGVRRGEASCDELLVVLSRTKAVRGKLDAAQALIASSVAGARRHGDGGAHLLAQSTGMSRRDARSQVRTAEAMGSMPAVRDAVEDGRVSFVNAKRLADAGDKTSAGDVDSDAELLAKAESLPPEQFAKKAKRWTAERQADGGEAQYRWLRARRAVRMWNGDDGMVHLYGHFDPVTGRRIRNRLNQEAHRLYGADKEQARAGGETRSLQQCMADALENMAAGTAVGGKPYADIALVARLDPDTEELMASTADGEPLPPAVVERLACGSSWFGLVLSAKGVPMWKGRNIRRATESQFQALMALYGGCAGCDETDRGKIQAHHMDPFARGGPTDLDNMIPLCWGCHNKIHDHNWLIADAGGGKRTIRPPDPVHHGPARLPDTAPLFAPSDLVHHGPARLPDTAPLSGSAEQTAQAARGAATGSSSGEEDGNRESGNGESGNRSRAGPTGPQAARAVLRRARAARGDALERAQIGDRPPVVVLARLECRVQPQRQRHGGGGSSMLALVPRVVDALFAAFEPHIPEREVPAHPLGCHRPRIADRDVFEAILFRLVTGCSWDVAGRLGKGGETTLRNRYNEWNAHGAFDALVAEAINGYDRIVGLDLSDASVDASVHKAPCGGEGTGKSPVDRGKSGWKWSLLCDRSGIPVGWAADGANRHDQTLLEPTLRGAERRGLTADVETLHLDRGYAGDPVLETCCAFGIHDVLRAPKRPRGRGRRKPRAVPLGMRWTIERTNSWLSNFGQLRRSTDRSTKARLGQLALAVAVIITVKLFKWADRWNPA